jgi:glutamyl/glutaminyl-tRNA synthetase
VAFIYGPDGEKLSKRHGATAISQYRSRGYLPEALVNYLILLGWSPKDDREILDLQEVIKLFKLKDVRDAGPRFDFKKLNWINGVYIRKKPDKQLLQLIKPFAPEDLSDDLIAQTIPLIKERIKTLQEYSDLVDFLVKRKMPSVDDLIPKGKTGKETKAMLLLAAEELEKIKKNNWHKSRLEEVIRGLRKKTDWSKRELFMTLRVAATGKKITPPLFGSLALLGKRETLSRLRSTVGPLE